MKTNFNQFNFICAVLFTILPSLAFSQLTKGTILLGPSLDFSSFKEEYDGFDLTIKTTELRLELDGGYFVADNFEVGIGLGVFSRTNDIDNEENRITGISIGPHINYYLGLSDEVQLLIGGGLAYNSSKLDDDFNGEVKLTGIGYGLRVGLHYLANEKLGAFISVGPDFGKFTEEESEIEIDWNEIDARIGVNFFF